MGQQTVLYQTHVAAQAKIVDFAGWDMPLHYGSQLNEHHAVRTSVGIFDVSHMLVVDMIGAQALHVLRRVLANAIDKVDEGQAQYGCILNDSGGVIDDLIVYRRGDSAFRIVVNAATAEKDLNWLGRHADTVGGVTVTPRRDRAIIAVQGPQARQLVTTVFPEYIEAKRLKAFSFEEFADGVMIARTGYTGEDGFECIVPTQDAERFWQRICTAGATPCGLAARDSLRLEAGLNLYGQDMDETTSPFESALAWTVAMDDDRDFIGKAALERQREQGVKRQLVGLLFAGRGILRHGMTVSLDGCECGVVTSGGFSPTLERSIAFARLASDGALPAQCDVTVRGQPQPARIVMPPFVRRGKIRISLDA